MLTSNAELIGHVLLGASLGLGLFIIFLLLAVIAICIPGFRGKSYKTDLEEKKKKNRKR